MRTAGVVLLVAGCLFAAAAPAQAQLSFTETQTVSTGETNGTQPAVAVDPGGNAVGVWREVSGGVQQVKAAFRPARGFFAPAQTLTSGPGDALDLKVVVADDGTAIAGWYKSTSIQYAIKPAGATQFGPVTTIAGARDFDVAFDRAGTAMLLTTLPNASPAGGRLEARTRPAGGAFGAPAVLDVEPDLTATVKAYFTEPRIGLDAAGNAALSWSLAFGGTTVDPAFADQVRATYRPAGGAFEPRAIVADRGSTTNVRDAIPLARNGSAVLLWDHQHTNSAATAEYARRTGPGAWSAPVTYAGSTSGGSNTAAVWLDAGTDDAGNVIATLLNGLANAEGYLPAGATTFSAPQPLPGRGRLAVSRDGSAGLLTVDPGGGAVAYHPRAAGAAAAYGPAVPLGAADQDPALAIGATGFVAAMWARTDGANLRVQARFGDPPVPPGQPQPPVPVVPVLPPPPPAPPVPSAIQPARPITADDATVLTVAVSGRVDRLEWQVGGGRVVTATRTGAALPTSIRLRLRGAPTVRVRAIGPGGTTTSSRAFAVPKDPADADARKVRAGEPSGTPDVYAVGDAATLLGRGGCGATTIVAGGRVVSGCFTPIDAAGDIPGAESGALAALASAYRLRREDAALMQRAVGLTDGYLATGRVLLDGRWPVEPKGGAKVAWLPQAEALVSSNADFRVAGRLVGPAGNGFDLHLDTAGNFIDLGTVRSPGGLKLGGFPLVGDLDVQLGGGFAKVQTTIEVPRPINRNGIPIRPRIGLYATPDGFDDADGLTLGPYQAAFGPLGIKAFKVTYRAATDTWEGGADLCIFVSYCLDFQPPDGGLRFAGGELVYAKTSHTFGSPGQILAPGLFLERIGMGFGLDPTRVFGDARLGLGGVVKIDGKAAFVFPSGATPYRLRRDEVGSSFPAASYETNFTRPLAAASADVLIALPVLGETKLGGGYMLWEDGSYLLVGGGAAIDVLGIFSVAGGMSGEFDTSKGRSNLHGDIRACLTAIDDDLCAGAVAHLSRGVGLEGGAGACAQLGPVSVGAGRLWARAIPFVWPLDGCKWSPFRIDIRAAAAQADGSRTVTVKEGDPPVAIQLNGKDAAPTVKITGPGGQTLQSADDGLAVSADRHVRIVRFNHPSGHFTTIGLQGAKPGAWKIETLPGSAPITGVAKATDPGDAEVTGRVTSGSTAGDVRVLTYDVRRRPGQRVTFYDQASGGARKALRTVTGGTGRIRFTPGPGRGTHRIIAAFELSGLGAEQRTVARFAPPSPVLATPKRLQVRRNGTSLRVAWGGVLGARRYEVTLTTSDGRQVFRTARTASASFARVARTAGGTVTVRAVAPSRASKVARRTFRRASTRRSGPFSRLARCRVGKKKVSCR